MNKIETHLNDMLDFLQKCKEGPTPKDLMFNLGKQFSRLSVEEQGEFVFLWNEALRKTD